MREDREQKERICGGNVLEEEEKSSVVRDFLGQLNDPLIFILLAAAAISVLLGEYGDMMIIAAVVILNATVGVIQEGRARRALEALKKLTSPHAWIREGDQIRQIPAADLMVGDLVCLEAGRQVPADLKLTKAVHLKIEESSFTGESVPVSKNTTDRSEAFMTSNVIAGRGEGTVTAIGMDTQIGKIAGMIRKAPEQPTPLQHRLAELGKILGALSVGLCVLLFAAAMLQKRDAAQMLITAISLAVAVVPEGLPAVVTLVLALSVSRMVKVNAIVKRLPSVETLGCVSVVCSDKTGTLTQNRMSVVSCYTDGYVCRPSLLDRERAKDFLSGFVLCNDASADGTKRRGDPTELALLDMAQRHGIRRSELEKELPRTGEIAFDSARKRMTTSHRGAARRVSYTKGSPDEVIARCDRIAVRGNEEPMTDRRRRELAQVLEQFAGDALRVLALAKREGADQPQEEGMTFLGFVGIADPVRPEAKPAVEAFRRAGVKTVMVTGDRSDTAFAVAKELGIAECRAECITGEELDGLSEEEFRKRLPSLRVFAHVSPEHKVRIVDGCRSRGDVVAMTGDGVNDAPSLRHADVGIAMGIAGTDVARSAADIVLADDNFATIARAMIQGRCIYENIRKAVIFLLSSNFGEMITMVAAVACGLVSPLKSGHILWINLITDSLPALALGIDTVNEARVVSAPPRAKTENLFAGGGLCCTVFYGLLIAFVSMAAFLHPPLMRLAAARTVPSLAHINRTLQDPLLLAQSRTYAFTVLGMSQLFHAVGMRDVEQSVFGMKHLENRLMIAALCFGIGLQLLVTEVPFLISLFGTVPLSPAEWVHLLFLALAPLGAHECLIVMASKQQETQTEETRKSRKKTGDFRKKYWGKYETKQGKSL